MNYPVKRLQARFQPSDDWLRVRAVVWSGKFHFVYTVRAFKSFELFSFSRCIHLVMELYIIVLIDTYLPIFEVPTLN
jgi:hypothetical protein